MMIWDSNLCDFVDHRPSTPHKHHGNSWEAQDFSQWFHEEWEGSEIFHNGNGFRLLGVIKAKKKK